MMPGFIDSLKKRASRIRNTISTLTSSLFAKVIGTASRIPIIGSIVARIFPQFINRDNQVSKVVYRVSFKELKRKAYTNTDLYNYIAEIALLLRPKQQELDAVLNEKREETAKEFERDLPRFSEVHFVLGSENIVSTTDQKVEGEALNPDDLNRLREDQISMFLNFVESKAIEAKKTWVNKEILRDIINTMQQKLIGRMLGTIPENFVFVKKVEDGTTQSVNNLRPISNREAEKLNFPDKSLQTILKMEDQKISFIYEQYLFCAPEVDTMVNQRDLKVKITTTVDFAALSDKPGEFLANKDGITQEVVVESVSDVKFSPSLQVLRLIQKNDLGETLSIVSKNSGITTLDSESLHSTESSIDEDRVKIPSPRKTYIPSSLSTATVADSEEELENKAIAKPARLTKD